MWTEGVQGFDTLPHMVIDLKVLVRSFKCEEWPFPDKGILIRTHIYTEGSQCTWVQCQSVSGLQYCVCSCYFPTSGGLATLVKPIYNSNCTPSANFEPYMWFSCAAPYVCPFVCDWQELVWRPEIEAEEDATKVRAKEGGAKGKHGDLHSVAQTPYGRDICFAFNSYRCTRFCRVKGCRRDHAAEDGHFWIGASPGHAGVLGRCFWSLKVTKEKIATLW